MSDYIKKLKEKIAMPKGIDSTSFRDLDINILTRLKRLEENLKSSSLSLKEDTSAMINAGHEMRSTIKKEVSRIALAFEVYGTNMKSATIGAANATKGLGDTFYNTTRGFVRPFQQIAEYSKRFLRDGVQYMPYNGYQAFCWAFLSGYCTAQPSGSRVRGNKGLLPILRDGFINIRNNAYQLRNNLSNMGNMFERAPKELASIIKSANANIEAAINKFLSSFGGLTNNLGYNLNKQ